MWVRVGPTLDMAQVDRETVIGGRRVLPPVALAIDRTLSLEIRNVRW